MGKFNSVQLEKKIPFLIARDGRQCRNCRTPFENLSYKIQVGHLDGNKDNNPADGSNWGLLCMRCNLQQEKDGEILQLSDRPMTPEMEKRDILRPLFLKEINHRISEHHSCCVGEAIYDVTMVIGASVQFGRDNLKQEIGTSGIWAIGPGKCNSPLCKKKHIYLKDEVPHEEE